MGALDSLEAPLEQAAARAADDPSAMSMVARLRAMREHARAALIGADPALVTDQVLSTAQSHVQNLGSQLSTYLNGTGVGYLGNAITEADSLFAVLARVPAQITGPRAAAVTRALGAYHETVERYTKAVQEQLGSLQNRITQLTGTTSAAEQRVAK